ncbi:MAG: hypothetical protein ACUVSX_03445 [Aggregatilineales bacterium]
MRSILLCLLLALVVALPLTAQDSAPPISAELLAQLEAIEAFVYNQRGLAALEPIERRFPTRDEALAHLRAVVEAELPPEANRLASDFYIAFDLLPPGSDYRALYFSLLSQQVGGYYDTSSRTMNTLLLRGSAPSDSLPLLEQIVYAHEYVHALQDQHFGIEGLQAAAGDDTDRGFAVLALLEGDATVVMNAFTSALSERNPLGVGLALLLQGAQSGGLTFPPGTPPILEREMLAAYLDGAAFVSALHRAGGWDAVNAAYANPPQSSEHILRPQAYLDGDQPQAVKLAAFDLGPGWENIAESTLGQFYLREYLRTQLTAAAAAGAAAGWGGDRYRLYRYADSGALAWVMKIVWDTAADAAEFAEALDAFAALRFNAAESVSGCWAGEADALCFDASGGASLLAFGPTLDAARALLAGQR